MIARCERVIILVLSILETGHLPELERDEAKGSHGERGRWQLTEAFVKDYTPLAFGTWEEIATHEEAARATVAEYVTRMRVSRGRVGAFSEQDVKEIAGRFNGGHGWREKPSAVDYAQRAWNLYEYHMEE